MRLVVLLFLTSLCSAQVINGVALQRITSSNYVRALPTANVSTCLVTDNAIPCTQFVTAYTDSTLSVACVTLGTPVSGPNCSNPGLADADGNYTIFVPAGLYTVCVSSGTSLNCYKASTGGGTGCSSGCVVVTPSSDQIITGLHRLVVSHGSTSTPQASVEFMGSGSGTIASFPSLVDIITEDSTPWALTIRNKADASGNVGAFFVDPSGTFEIQSSDPSNVVAGGLGFKANGDVSLGATDDSHKFVITGNFQWQNNNVSDIGASAGARPRTGYFATSVVAPVYQTTLSTPGSSSASCTAGQVWADTGFVYVCTSANTIKRAALSAF